jgi:hypothetical protein
MRMFNPVLNPELAGFFGDNMEFDDNWSKNSQNVVIDSNYLFYLLFIGQIRPSCFHKSSSELSFFKLENRY